jgi:prophage regulatory protein
MTDILERLSRDAGALTFREPIEDRVRAAEEIRRLRSDVAAMKTRWAVRSARPEPERRVQAGAEVGLNPSRLVRLRELRAIVGLSRTTIFRMVNEGRFPKPVKLSTHASAWRMAEVLAWQESLGE